MVQHGVWIGRRAGIDIVTAIADMVSCSKVRRTGQIGRDGSPGHVPKKSVQESGFCGAMLGWRCMRRRERAGFAATFDSDRVEVVLGPSRGEVDGNARVLNTLTVRRGFPGTLRCVPRAACRRIVVALIGIVVRRSGSFAGGCSHDFGNLPQEIVIATRVSVGRRRAAEIGQANDGTGILIGFGVMRSDGIRGRDRNRCFAGIAPDGGRLGPRRDRSEGMEIVPGRIDLRVEMLVQDPLGVAVRLLQPGFGRALLGDRAGRHGRFRRFCRAHDSAWLSVCDCRVIVEIRRCCGLACTG